MSPWNRIENDFFWITFSTKAKQFIIGWFWKGRVYHVKINIKLQVCDLVDDGVYNTEHERYQKESYVGPTHKSKQRPHQTGIYHNWNAKQLSTLPHEERFRELNRRRIESSSNGT